MKNNTEWLEPLKNRPGLLMDDETSKRMERELRGTERKEKLLPLWIPSVAVSALVVMMLVVVGKGVLPGDDADGLSAEMKETLSVFHETGEPAYYLTVLPFEPEQISATELQLSFSRSVALTYIGNYADKEHISVYIYFDMPDGFNFGPTDYEKNFETINGDKIDYSVKQTRPDLQTISWIQDDATFQIMNMHDPLIEAEIEELINSMKKYE
ncbi:hypothetical protein [Sutcliffiella sp. FSL R7-0096]|uniref:hypothetical protein n=1 Tax=Sutcliffiella sp. FSL R7-0096 TaxID=2921670 RepID=UPI00315B17ED